MRQPVSCGWARIKPPLKWSARSPEKKMKGMDDKLTNSSTFPSPNESKVRVLLLKQRSLYRGGLITNRFGELLQDPFSN